MKTYLPAYRLLHLFLLIILALPLMQCRKKSDAESFINPAFTGKISAFTAGVISSESTIQIILAEDYKGQVEANSPVEKEVFRFKPAIKGQAYWVDKRTIEFRPEKKLISGTDYSARFFLSKILDVSKELSVLEFRFSVVKQAFTVSIEGYQSINENDLVWNRIKASINTADYVDNEVINKYFTATQNERMLQLHWDVSSDRRSFALTVDSIRRTEKQGKVVIQWDATALNTYLKGSLEIEIPALGDFKVMDATVVQLPEQYMQISFSDPIRKNQNFEGLVYLDNNVSMNFSVSGNILKAYPAERQNGGKTITVSGELINILGYPLKSGYSKEITFELPKPAVRISGKGVILPTSRGLVFPFDAVNLSAVDVRIIKIYENNIGYFLQVNRLDGNEQLKRAGRLVHKETLKLNYEPVDLGKWNRFYLDLGKLIQPDPGSIYRVEISYKQSYSLYYCEGQVAEESGDVTETNAEDDLLEEDSYWDSYEDYYDEYYEYYEDYEWDDRDNPCSSSYYTQNRWVSRNILASDLGIIVKAGEDNSFQCAVTNLVTTQPIANVEVMLYNFQQQPLARGVTDNEGFVNLTLKDKPFLLIAKNDKQRGYLRLDDGASLSLGAFDVTGEEVQKGLKGFIFGERGVWRPGDTLFISFLLEDKKKVLPAMHPVIFELYSPQGQLYARAVKTTGMNGFYTLAQPTNREIPTGNWNLKVKVGGTQFSKTLKIETIKPNRLKIDLKFGASLLTASGPDATGDLSVKWLHGATARNLRTTVGVLLTTAPTVFSTYKDYQFTDPSRVFSSEEQMVYEGSTDENGLAQVSCPIRAESSPGMLKANFTVRVFEKGGDFSIDRFSMPYSPFKTYVGLKTPVGDKRGMLLTDTTHWVEVVTLDESGKPVSRSGLEMSVYKLNWRNWWETEDQELADYVGNTYNQPVVAKNISTLNGKGRFSFRINRPEWGRYYVRITDRESGHSAGKVVYIDWPGWAGRPMRDNPEAASMLTFNTDKQKYAVGEEAEIIIPTGGTGRALLSLESGSRILEKKWLVITEKETRVKLPVTAEMAPNVYIHVTLIQPHASSENDMPMRLYGVVPIFVEDPQTRLTPVIKMPETLEPLQQFSVQVSERSKKEMTYTLAIVEEGLLDLTRFKTPDPWNHFYAREALGVRTWDLYDMVIGAYGGRLESILGIGGDDQVISNEPGEKANRFKPLVKFMGPFTLAAGGTNRHSLKVPNYIGSVRVMVVGGQEGAYGYSEKTVPVKKPMMILATLPRVMGPDESVTLPVTVFAMASQVKDVRIQVKTNALLIAAETVKSLHFDTQGDAIINFNLKAASKTGKGLVSITATSGNLTSVYEVELDIRTPNPPVTTFIAGSAETGKSWNTDFNLPGMENTNSALLEVSGIPPIDAGRRLKYLVQYPHGCIEQTTSAAFAQLYMTDVLELDSKTKETIDKNIKAGISRIRTFQLASGGFSYWSGQPMNTWGSSYAGHFLLEAEKKGYVLPAGFKSAWIKSQKQLARQWTPVQQKDPYQQDDLDQAYRLYTLALAGEPETGAMNRMREQKDLTLQAKWRLAAAFGLTGQVQVAWELVGRESAEIQPYSGFTSSYGSRERDWAMILETMVMLNDKTRGAVLARRLSEALSSARWLSTQTTAYCLLSMAKFARGNFSGELNFTYKAGNGKTLHIVSSKPLVQIALPISEKDKSGHIDVNNTGKGLVFTRVVMEGIPAASKEQEFSHSLSLSVSYRNSEGNSLDVSNLNQGTDFYAVVTVGNTGDFDYHDLALSQVFPSGWEIANARIADFDIPVNTAFTYQDIRDDRVYTYFDLRRDEKKSFVIQVNAAYVGAYYLPGTYCEAMYDNSIGAMKQGMWVKVNVGN